MSDWLYWLLFAAVVLIALSFPLAARLEERQARRDREVWDRMRRPGVEFYDAERDEWVLPR